jgi:hypothetical protein
LNELPRSLIIRRGLVAFVILASAWGFFVHGKAAVRMAVHEWNFTPNNVDHYPERLWDWTDMQIFR